MIGDPSLPDDRNRARMVMAIGADYWLNETAEWDNFRTNAGVGGGRYKYVTTDWQSFNFTTVPLDQFAYNPPPLND